MATEIEGEHRKLGFFERLLSKKKKKEEKDILDEVEEEEEKPKEVTSSAGATPSIGKLTADLDRLKAQFDSFKEIRKAFTERFTRVSEQIGELRSMLIERDRSMQKLEAKTLKAVDMVEAVQPDKLMVEVRKQDGKIEALRASLESNEAIMNRISEELRTIRQKMDLYKGVEQVMKMNEEVKGELINIKKIEATVGAHADKVETMFMEMQKRFKELEMFKTQLNEALLDLKDQSSEINALKIRMTEMVKKEDLDKVINQLKKHIEGIKEKLGKSPLSKDIDSLRDMLENLRVG